MSGYRTLHRINPEPQSKDPLFHVQFSPCRPAQNDASLRLLTTGASNKINIYSLRERKDTGENSLDATPLIVGCNECLVPSDFDIGTPNKCALGYGSLDVARNYCGADTLAGQEVVVASQLGGRVGVWIRLDRGKKDPDLAPSITTQDEMTYITPDVEFEVPNATGTTLAIRPPILANYYSKHEKDIIVAFGSADGSVILCRLGIYAAKPGESATSSGVVGDSSSNTDDLTIKVKSGSTPGEVVATVGGGHSCVLSLVWHPTIPNMFAVGRKDGTIDIYSSTSSHDKDLSFRRMHRLTDASAPIRGLTFSQPSGALLFVGDDSGKLYSYDASVMSTSFNEHYDATKAAMCPIKLVAFALTAHKGWIMNLISFPDEKRVCSCGSDRSVKVWDCGTGLSSSMPVHSFDSVHSGWVWDVACGSVVGDSTRGVANSKKKLTLVSCGNDGVMQVFSCGD